MRPVLLLIGLLAIAGLLESAAAQDAGQAIAQTEAGSLLADMDSALEAGNDERAKALAERIVQAEEGSADAHYRVAGLYFKYDRLSDADRAIDRALEQSPFQVDYMELKLWIGFPRAFPVFIQQTNRMELARKILALDPANAYAHEVIGMEYAEMYEDNRRLIRIPRALLFQTGGEMTSAIDLANRPGIGMDEEDAAKASEDDLFVQNLNVRTGGDRFDIEFLKQNGVLVVDASSKAPSAWEDAEYHLNQSFQSNPDRLEVGLSLLRLYVREEEYERAWSVLDGLHGAFSNVPEYWLFKGLLQYRIGDLAAANGFFEQAIARMPRDMLASFLNVAAVQSPLESAAPADSFWTGRDVRFLTSVNERQTEHRARLAYAALFFEPHGGEQFGWETARGRLHVRYGLPIREYMLAESEERAKEQPELGGEFFESAQSRSDFLSKSVSYFQIWEYGDFRFVFADTDRSGRFELWSPRASSASWYQNMDFVTMEKNRAIEVPERSTLEEALPRVEFPYLVSVFKGAGSRADVLVPFGIPLGRPTSETTADLALNRGLFLLDADGSMAAEFAANRDQPASGSIRTFEEAIVWTSTMQLSGQPGAFDLSVEWESADGTALGYHRAPVTIPDFGSSILSMSDIMPAYHVEEDLSGSPSGDVRRTGGVITRNEFVIQPSPWGVFSTDQPVYVYFEGYHLALDADGTTRYEIEALLAPQDAQERGRLGRLFGGRDAPGVSVRFEDSGRTSDVGRYLILDASDLEPGTFQLVVRLRDIVSRAEVSAQRTVILE